MSEKKRIAVVFGGRSIEHEISVLSAMQAMDALDVEKYEIIPVYIDTKGKWYTGKELRNRSFYKNVNENLASVTKVRFLPEPGIGGLIKFKNSFLGTKESIIPVDVFVPVFHGQFGEDGCVQGLFELANVPYAGPETLASAIAMNKQVCKKLLQVHGIPVLPSFKVTKKEAQADVFKICNQILETEGLSEYPLFVKPNNLGSSVGVGKARTIDELAACLAKVFKFDLEAIVEPCVNKLMEINVSVLEADLASLDGEPLVSVVEIPVTEGDFLSYEDKYLREGKGKKGGTTSSSQGMASLTRVIDPKDLDSKYRDAVQEYARRSYKILNCSGVVRFDFMVNLENGELYFNELNPIPGSLSFYLWERTKPAFLMSDILDRLIKGAQERFALKNQLTRDFGFKALS